MKKTETYRILGVDPGTNILGYAVLEIEQNTPKLLIMGVVHLSHLDEQQHKLKHIFERLQEIIKEYSPREMAIEAPFFGKNVQAMLKLGRAQGVAIAAAITKDVPITEYSPRKVKQSITGNGNSSKEQVAAMLKTLLQANLEGQYFDATDATAIALCHYYQAGNLLGGRKRYNDWGSFAKDNKTKIK